MVGSVKNEAPRGPGEWLSSSRWGNFRGWMRQAAEWCRRCSSTAGRSQHWVDRVHRSLVGWVRHPVALRLDVSRSPAARPPRHDPAAVRTPDRRQSYGRHTPTSALQSTCAQINEIHFIYRFKKKLILHHKVYEVTVMRISSEREIPLKSLKFSNFNIHLKKKHI